MFKGACDLIVLPCSATGTVTQFVFNRLQSYKIPAPSKGMKLGDIEILPFKGGENIAQYVAFAVSVDNNYSELSAIESIGKKIGELAITNSALEIINIPLLGAGAGALQSEKVVEALKRGFQSKSSNNSTLIIHVLHAEVFNRITEYFKGVKNIGDPHDIAQPKQTKPTRVFISWTKTDDNHWTWTVEMAKYLRDNGIDSRIDIWHLRAGMDLPQFMVNELSLADKVLIISNEQYAAKADGRTGGVGWETMIIQGDMSKLPADSTKYLTIVKSENIDTGLPIYLKSKYVIHWTSSTKEIVHRQRLLNDLLNVIEAPQIGVAPVFL
ncbi:MAG: TIR domain-containing protein [Limnohabitans sp.]|nr:TIR domain-containing protein [Limnohabitans sp.]